jgi:polysaccharide deacetylase family protein (PEP-CTERM system associated)
MSNPQTKHQTPHLPTAPINAMTIDVEDYYQVAAFEKIVAPSDWDKFESRVVANTRRFLELLASRNVKATFFVLGYEAERHPELVREIAGAGHEIGSHGYAHRLAYTQSEAEFRDEVARARQLLQDLSGQDVLSYRAPSFSIGRRTPWGHRVLVEEGYKYDSSVFPIRHDLYGDPGAPVEIHTIATESGPIIEFPPTVVRFLGRNIPTGGGGYFRIFPWWFTRRLLTQVNKKRPFVFYIHPWDIDPDQPRFDKAPFKSRFRHYTNLHKTTGRFLRLLEMFHFAPLGEVLEFIVPPTKIALVR